MRRKRWISAAAVAAVVGTVAMTVAMAAGAPSARFAQADECQDDPFGLGEQQYVLVIHGDLHQESTDSEGRIAVGGDATLVSFGVGSRLPVDADRIDLAVGGVLNATNVGVNNGSITYGDALNGNATAPNGTITQRPLDLDAYFQEAQRRSEFWGGFDTTGDISGPGDDGALYMIGTDPDAQRLRPRRRRSRTGGRDPHQRPVRLEHADQRPRHVLRHVHAAHLLARVLGRDRLRPVRRPGAERRARGVAARPGVELPRGHRDPDRPAARLARDGARAGRGLLLPRQHPAQRHDHRRLARRERREPPAPAGRLPAARAARAGPDADTDAVAHPRALAHPHAHAAPADTDADAHAGPAGPDAGAAAPAHAAGTAAVRAHAARRRRRPARHRRVDGHPGPQAGAHHVRGKRVELVKRRPGQLVRFRLRGYNQGFATARAVRACDIVPRGLALVRAPGDPVVRKRRICWNLGAVDTKRAATITFRVRARVCGRAVNRIVVRSRNGGRDRDRADVSACRRVLPRTVG